MSVSEIQIFLGLLCLSALIYLATLALWGHKRPEPMRGQQTGNPELDAAKQFRWVFRSYAVRELNHRQTMQEIEKSLVIAKLQLMINKEGKNGSILPDVAKSMGMSLSNVYALLDKYDISVPEKSEKSPHSDNK